MTWIAARKRYPRRAQIEHGQRRPGRPATRSHLSGVWVIDPATNMLHPCWHQGRTLVSVIGSVSRRCSVLLEMEDAPLPPDWYAKALKKRLVREGFAEVWLVGTDEVTRMLMRRNQPVRREVDWREDGYIPDAAL